MIFEIQGKIKPYVRMTQRGKWVEPNAIEYLRSKRSIQLQIKNQMTLADLDKLPDKTPLKASIAIRMPGVHKCDLDNLVKALLDAAQAIAFKDDRWIDAISATRKVDTDYACVFSVEVI